MESAAYNSTIRGKTYQGPKEAYPLPNKVGEFSKEGAAWLSKARVVRCAVNSVNERNLDLILYVRRNVRPIKRLLP